MKTFSDAEFERLTIGVEALESTIQQQKSELGELHKRYQAAVIDAYIQLDTNKKQAKIMEQMAESIELFHNSMEYGCGFYSEEEFWTAVEATRNALKTYTEWMK